MSHRYTCEQLGICQGRGCPGCPNTDLPSDNTPWDRMTYWGSVLVVCGLSVGVLAGIAGYLWGIYVS